LTAATATGGAQGVVSAGGGMAATEGAAETAQEMSPDSVAMPEAVVNMTAAAAAAAARWCLPEPA
jgi:hypothetical protein